MTLTRRERELLSFIETYIAKHAIAPSLSEMAEQGGVVQSTIHERLASLEFKGYIRRQPMHERSIEIVAETDRVIGQAVARVAGPDDRVYIAGVGVHVADLVRVLTGPAPADRVTR